MSKRTSKAPDLAPAIDAARNAPDDAAAWDELEELAASTQHPEEVAALYREILSTDLDPALVAKLGERAVQFHEEWFAEDAPALVEVLGRVIELDPSAEWAFQRLTVVHTAAGHWDDLLALYDQALASPQVQHDELRRVTLLDEAANLAKDFASAPDRAIAYMQQLLPLRPKDKQLPAALERLLERESRWEDLIAFWSERLPALKKKEANAARLRIAQCYLDQLERPADALSTVADIFEAGDRGDEPLALLESIGARRQAPDAVRRQALAMLRDRYAADGRDADVVRILELAVSVADREERVELHRQAGDALAAQGEHARAMEHFADLLSLSPGAGDAVRRLRRLAETTGAHQRFAEALVQAAEHADDSAQRVALRVEAADTHRTKLADLDGAIALYRQVLGETEAEDAVALKVARRLNELFQSTGRLAERLQILESLAAAEPEAADRRTALGQAARIADELGDPERALRSWQRRLEDDAHDLEGLEATIGILEREARWEPLIETLRLRTAAPVQPTQRRADLVHIAKVQAQELDVIDDAIATWTEVAEGFGEDAEVVDALADLFSRARRWADVASVYQRAADREAEHVGSIYARMGDLQREHLNSPDAAAEGYASALRVDPGHERARAGLIALLDDPRCRATAAEALAMAYEATDEWSSQLTLLEHRLEVAPDSTTRVRLLREAASIQEMRAEDSAAALDSMRRAMALAPEMRDIEADVFRLGEATGNWDVAVAAIRDAIGALGAESPRARYLRFWEGKLVEENLGDPSSALEAYGEVFDADPTRREVADAVIRTAARVERWSRVASTVVDWAASQGAIDPDLVARAAAAASEASAWDALADAMAENIRATASLRPKIGRDLETLLSKWHIDHREDLHAAEEALQRAARHDDAHVQTLRALADLQRPHPGRPLFDTLMRLADLAEDDLDPLREAAELAFDPLGESELGRTATDRLYREASRLWKRGATGSGQHTSEACTRWALEKLAELHMNDGHADRAVSLLTDAALLPVGGEVSRDLRRRAAEIAVGANDRRRAIVLYRGILDELPDDEAVLAALADVCDAEGNLTEMLALRRHELSLCRDPERRLVLRLDLVRLVDELVAQGGRVEMLEANLEESAGHEPSVLALTEVLEKAGRFAELADKLTSQATRIESLGEPRRAGPIWAKVASLAEARLGDVDRALLAHRKVVEVAPTLEALDALARLHTDRGEHASAARWLDRRLQDTTGAERVDIALSLARAHLGAEQTPEAISALEAVREEAPDRADVREMLAAQYRATRADAPLARLLAEAAPHVDDTQTLLAYAREAAELYGKLGSPDKATSILEKAAEAAPEERDIRVRLAEGLLKAGRFAEARELLSGVIESYGRRRNAERAAVHLQLARVARAEGNLEAALEELELASKMDVSSAIILRMLGQAAHDAGELDRAERAYRALLLIVRRQQAGDDPDAVGMSEVQYELHRLAKHRGDEDQARELFESALETGTQSETEARRLQRTVLERGDPELALRVLEKSLERVQAREAKARLLAEIGALLEEHLGRGEAGLARMFEAVELLPSDPMILDRARGLAARVGATEKYADVVAGIIERVIDREPDVASALLMGLGLVCEEDLGDLDRARKLYERVESLGRAPAEAWMAIARVAGARGDARAELAVLEKIVQAQDVDFPAARRVDAMYRMAEVRLSTGDDDEEGIAALEAALAREPRNARAAAILSAATDRASDDARMLRLYERVVRATGDAGLLLDVLEKRSVRPDATLGEIREGVDLATQKEDADLAERLLVRGSEIAEGSEEGLSSAPWIPEQLAALRRAAGDVKGAVEWLQRAAVAADEDRAFDLWLEAAQLASSDEGDLNLAAEVYGRLLPRDPMDKRVWQPLLSILRRLGDEARLSDLAAATIDGLLDPVDRNAVRMEKALFLLDQDGREPDAADVLRVVLDEQPDHPEAGGLLADLFERTGYDEELVDLLGRQLDVARDNQDSPTIKEHSLKLGALLEKVRREDAMDVYRRGLDWLPEDRELAQALLAQFGPDDDPRERIEVLERLLATEQGAEAARLAQQLAAQWESLEDDDGVQRALELGYRGCPEDDTIRERLGDWYRNRELWEPLARFIENEAARIDEPRTSVQLLREAAALWGTSVGSPASAADALLKARVYAPSDVDLLRELVRMRVASGDPTRAVDEVALALEEQTGGRNTKQALLRIRAELRLALGQEQEAIEDLEEAYGLAGADVISDLVVGLRQQRSSSAQRGDFETERRATLRLVVVLEDGGDVEQAREMLVEWVARAPQDREALLKLRDVDEGAQRWDALAETCERLVQIESGEDQVDAALRLAHACERAGRPDAAIGGLEHVLSIQGSVLLRERLRSLYEQAGAHLQLASMLMQDAEATEDIEARFELLRHAGDLFLQAGDAQSAGIALSAAFQLRPDDHPLTVLLVDSHIASGRYADAGQMLEQAIAAHTRRRSPELAELQHRMARLAQAAGDAGLQLEWLKAALDSDKGNGHVAAELAVLAMELGDQDVALNALRVVTLNKTDGPMSRAVAFLLQARIAHQRGEARRALLWARKARSEDPELADAEAFLRELGDG